MLTWIPLTHEEAINGLCLLVPKQVRPSRQEIAAMSVEDYANRIGVDIDLLCGQFFLVWWDLETHSCVEQVQNCRSISEVADVISSDSRKALIEINNPQFIRDICLEILNKDIDDKRDANLLQIEQKYVSRLLTTLCRSTRFANLNKLNLNSNNRTPQLARSLAAAICSAVGLMFWLQSDGSVSIVALCAYVSWAAALALSSYRSPSQDVVVELPGAQSVQDVLAVLLPDVHAVENGDPSNK